MLKQPEMRRLVDMQHRSYLLLKWMAKAVSEGFVNFETAHDYSTLPEAAEGWILGHFSNIPDNARPPREDLPAFCAFFSTYLTNSFDLISNPGQQLYSPDRQVFEDASLVAYGYDLLQREKGIANGPAVLALWRGFAWNESGSPKQGFRLKPTMILDAEARLLALLQDLGQNVPAATVAEQSDECEPE